MTQEDALTFPLTTYRMYRIWSRKGNSSLDHYSMNLVWRQGGTQQSLLRFLCVPWSLQDPANTCLSISMSTVFLPFVVPNHYPQQRLLAFAEDSI